jgi:hypothetical protein
MGRAYLRLDPMLRRRKRDYPDGAFRAFVEALCAAEGQPRRGRFESRGLLRVLLEKRGRWIPYLIENGDLVENDDGELYVDGWDQWQEGDLKVSERMALVRGSATEPPGLKRPGAIRVERHRLRTHIFDRDSYTCRYCGNGRYPREWLVMEHVDPVGPDEDWNLVTACRPCNKLKGGRTPDEAGMTLIPLSNAGNALPPEPVTRYTVEAVSGGSSKSGGIAPARATPVKRPTNEPERLPGEAPNPKHMGQHPDCLVCAPIRATAEEQPAPPEVSFDAPAASEEAPGA